jgi:crotonobetainyl-CoA:carnitine CoA-transferase CaiB-like acyl-CoA transferase
MAVAPLEKKFWDLFCDVLGRADWKVLHGSRGATADALRKDLTALFASRDQAYWQARFAAADCCVTPVLNVAEAIDHPQFLARNMTVRADGIRQYTPPLKLSRWAFAVQRVAPSVGEHSEEVLREMGFGTDEICALRQTAVI